MQDKSIWFDVDNVMKKADELWNNPPRRLKRSAVEQYLNYHYDNCKKSQALAMEAQNYIPGVVQHNLSVNYPFPVAMAKAEGPYMWDLDGNQYINYLQAGGPTMLGSNDPEIREKVIELMNTCGAVTGLFHEYELKLTKLINKHMPHVEMLRLFASGTEADMAMARVVRNYTEKPNIIKLEAGYHGWSDNFEYDMAPAGSKGNPKTGVLPDGYSHTQAVKINDLDAMRAQLVENEKNGGTAAVVIEPFGPNGGASPLYFEYVQGVRDLCDEFKSLLVFDEVITAFRVGLGGAAEFFGVKPDISVMGKVIAGNYPMAGGVGGRKEIIERFASAPNGEWARAHVGGTLSANPLSCVAGYYSILKQEREDVCGKAAEASLKLGNGMKDILAKYDLPFSVYMQPAIVHIDATGALNLRITEEKAAMIAKQAPERDAAQNEFAMGLLAEGLVTLVGRRLYTSYATTDDIIDETLVRFERLCANYE